MFYQVQRLCCAAEDMLITIIGVALSVDLRLAVLSLQAPASMTGLLIKISSAKSVGRKSTGVTQAGTRYTNSERNTYGQNENGACLAQLQNLSSARST